MSFNRDLNLRMADAARLVTGESDSAPAYAQFLESEARLRSAAEADADADAETELGAATMSEASLDALLNSMSEQTLDAFLQIKQTVLESAIESALHGSEFHMAHQWPEFLNKAASWVGDKASAAGAAIKDTAVNAYNTVKNADIHDISKKVGDFAGTVKKVADTVSEFSGPIAAATAGIPYVGAVTNAIDKTATVVGTAAGITETAANLIHDNTKPGETVGQALGRAKDAVVDIGNKVVDYAKNPSKLVDDVKSAGRWVRRTLSLALSALHFAFEPHSRAPATQLLTLCFAVLYYGLWASEVY